MADLALSWDASELAADLVVAANDLEREDGLETAVLLSLFTDRRAELGDVLPDGAQDRRGWWGDAFPVVEGDRIGSRLWLLDRAKQQEAVRQQAQAYAEESLAWLVEDRVASRVAVEATFPRAGMLGLIVSIYRPGRPDPTQYRFDAVWPAMEG